MGRLLTVVMDRTSARIFEVTAYGAKEIADIHSEATRGGKFHSDRHGAPGMGEHTYHNRIRNEKKRHLGTIAETLFRLDRSAPAHGLILAGIGTDAGSLTPFLHPYLKQRVMGTARLNPKETDPAHVHAATLEARARAEQESEAALVKQVRSGLGTGFFMYSLAGIPPTEGFMGKLYVFSAAIQANYIGLAIIGVINSVVSAFYYLRLTVVMYMIPTGSEPRADAPAVDLALTLAIVIAAGGTLFLGLFPSRILEAALRSVGALLG